MCRHYTRQTIVRTSEFGPLMVSIFPSGAPKWGGAMLTWRAPLADWPSIRSIPGSASDSVYVIQLWAPPFCHTWPCENDNF
jgi:hypothetical protein